MGSKRRLTSAKRVGRGLIRKEEREGSDREQAGRLYIHEPSEF